MLQEAAEETAHTDIVASARDSGLEAADATNDQLDLHSGGGGSVQGVDDVGVDQAVDLGEDAGLASGGGGGRFCIDEFHDAPGKVERRDDKVLELRTAQVACQHVEK